MNKTIDLRQPKYDLRKVEVGTVVITSKGFEFRLMTREQGKESWLDCTSKVIWYDREDETYTHYEAIERFKDALPTIEEFQKAEEHGFREVCPNMHSYWFWSSSLDSNVSEYARGFFGSDGDGDSGFRYGGGSVRCVGR